MVKIGLVGLKADGERVLTALHDLGVVQVEPLRKEAAALLAPKWPASCNARSPTSC